MLTSLGLIFLLGLTHGGSLPEDSPATYYRNVAYRNYSGTLCAGSAGCVDSEYLIDTAADRADHHFLKAGLSLDLKDLKKVGRSAVMLACVPATCELLGFCDICTHDPEHQQSGCGGHGCGSGSSVTCGCGAADGTSYGEVAMARRKAFRR